MYHGQVHSHHTSRAITFIPLELLHIIPFHSIPLHCIAFNCIALHSIALHSIAFHCIQLHSTSSHSIPFHSFHFISFHSTSFHSRQAAGAITQTSSSWKHTMGGSSGRLRGVMGRCLVQLLSCIQQQHDVAVLLVSGGRHAAVSLLAHRPGPAPCRPGPDSRPRPTPTHCILSCVLNQPHTHSYVSVPFCVNLVLVVCCLLAYSYTHVVAPKAAYITTNSES